MPIKTTCALRTAALVVLGAAASACVSVPDAPTMPLPAAYLNGATLGSTTATSAAPWAASVADNFSAVLIEEASSGVRNCMGGNGPRLDLRYHLLDLDRRDASSLGGGLNRTTLTARGRAELFDPRLRKVVGRFHIAVQTNEAAKFEEDGRSVARAFADDLCRQAFGRPAGGYIALPPAPSPAPGE